jgi:hypothetical protein
MRVSAASGQGGDEQQAQARYSDASPPQFPPMPQSAVHDQHIAAEYTPVVCKRHVRKLPGGLDLRFTIYASSGIGLRHIPRFYV